jgi:hypothetical protein
VLRQIPAPVQVTRGRGERCHDDRSDQRLRERPGGANHHTMCGR